MVYEGKKCPWKSILTFVFVHLSYFGSDLKPLSEEVNEASSLRLLGAENENAELRRRLELLQAEQEVSGCLSSGYNLADVNSQVSHVLYVSLSHTQAQQGPEKTQELQRLTDQLSQKLQNTLKEVRHF